MAYASLTPTGSNFSTLYSINLATGAATLIGNIGVNSSFNAPLVALAVVPDGSSPFEAYGPLREPMRPSQTFEGAFEWLVHTRALAETAWKNAHPWNAPTSAILKPGEVRTVGGEFQIHLSSPCPCG